MTTEQPKAEDTKEASIAPQADPTDVNSPTSVADINRLKEKIRADGLLNDLAKELSKTQQEKTKLDYYNAITKVDDVISLLERALSKSGYTTTTTTTTLSTGPTAREVCIERLNRLKERRKMLVRMFTDAPK